MPEHRNLKRVVRERMAETGENYTTALAALGGHGGADQPPERDAASARLAGDAATASTECVGAPMPFEGHGRTSIVDADGRSYEIGNMPLRIGRDVRTGNPERPSIRLHDPHVSRFHALVTAEADGVFVRDLDSTNGTYVDGVRVVSQRLTGGEVITVGRTTLTCLTTQAELAL